MTHPSRDMQIRDARADERNAIRELTLASYAEFATVMTPSAWGELERALHTALDSNGDAERIVAEQDGQLVGSVMLYPPAAATYSGLSERVVWPELRLLAVLPSARGQGVGRALVNECVERARRTGATALGLHTSESMRVALHIYEQMGFVRAPEFDFQPSGAELVRGYRLSLDAER